MWRYLENTLMKHNLSARSAVLQRSGLTALAVLLLLTLASCQSKEERFVNNLMSQMTYEEKLGQLNLLPVNGDIVTGAEVGEYDLGDRIAKGEVGGLFNLKGVDKIREAQRIAVERSRLGIPLIFGMDVIHGYETVFPIPLALSCSWDTAAIRLSAETAAKEATADGICWTFSPMVDICKDARWGRIAEGNGEDPFLGSAIAQAMVKGYQGTDLTSPYTMLACVKHFALYGGAEAGRDYNTVDMSPYRMANDYLPPYKAALDAGCGSVMAAFNTINGVPCHCNQWLLTDLLRKQWGFEGFVVTDYTGILELIAHRMGADLETVGQRALQAGCDMDMVSEALNIKWEATADKKRVDEACKRVLIAKYRLGLFDDPYRYCDDSRRATDIYTEATKAQARQLTTETFVLLKNKEQGQRTKDNHHALLPLDLDTKVALIGPLADTRANMAGTWSVAATFDYKTVREAFEEVLPKGHLFYAKGSNIEYSKELQQRGELAGRSIWDERTPEQMRHEAMAAARKADVIVLAMGETSEMSGESAARTSLTMPQAQQDLIDALATLDKPMILLNFSGRPVVLTHEAEVCDAILQVWFGGSETADAITDVVFGKVSPSGKLTTSFPRSVGQEPLGYRQYSTGRPIDDGEFIKYRSGYLDENTLPLYPFGYGLSYTTFERKCTMHNAQCTVKVTNTGAYAGAEVVQLYVRAHHSTWARPVRELRGFERVELAPGESKEVCFDITDETLGYYDDQMNFIVEPGIYDIFINDQLVGQICSPKTQSPLHSADFQDTVNGQPTALYTLTNGQAEVDITNFGGRIVSLRVPNNKGQLQDVVLGFDNIKDYKNIPSDFGACIGRYANRLNKGQITVNGVPYQLPTNNFGHTLHGGPTGWQYQVYSAEQINDQCLKLTIVSPDGDNGFPGQVTASCTYTLTEDNTLILDYEATTDAPTVINMTNHTYFNLNGDGSTSILNHVLWLNSNQMTPVDNTYMTTGEIVTIPAGDPFDFFTAPKTVGQDIEADNEQLHNGNGYDHNWVLRPSEEKLNHAATLYSPVTGIQLDVYTEEPGIQVYSGNFLDGTVTGKYGKVYKQRNAICLETQKYPDAPNKPQWPSAFLNPGEKYQTRTTFHFSVNSKSAH